jgi:hypothetical protein
MEKHIRDILKVGDIVRDIHHGDEWKVTDLGVNNFDAVCIKGSYSWEVGAVENWGYNYTSNIFEIVSQTDSVNHPTHYGGADNTYEAIKVIEAWDLNFCLGNAVKYISRAGKKDSSKTAEDLEKSIWYLNRELNKLKKDD